jgi:hypothetical protein
MKKQRLFSRITWGIVLSYVIVGILPFFILVGRHIFAIIFVEGHDYPDRLPIDFSWYELNNTIWIQLPLFIVALCAVIWLSRGNIWRQIVLGSGFALISLFPLLITAAQSVPGGVPKYNLSTCENLPLYVQKASWGDSSPIYTLHEGELLMSGMSFCNYQGICKGTIYKQKLEKKGVEPTEARQCIKERHKLSIGIGP